MMENGKTGWYNLQVNCGWCNQHHYDTSTFSLEGEESGVILPMGNESPIETPQMSMRKGFKLFGEGGDMAVKREVPQLHDQHVMAPINKKDLTDAQRRESLGYLIFLK